MDNRSEIRQFLTTRRARITPERAGLPAYGGHRRVPGLRREEVASLAGVSVEYFARLERGSLGGVSDSVLDALARALQLDEAECAYLVDLARHANQSTASPRRRAVRQVRPALRRLLDAMTEAPAFIRNGRLDVLAANRLGRGLYHAAFADPARPVNLARFLFLTSEGREFYPDWKRSAGNTVALLRTEAGRDPYNRELTQLVGELSTRSEEFRALWAAHNVRLHQSGVKTFRHTVVGELELAFEALPLPSDPGLSLTSYTAEPGSASHDGLRLLATWVATVEQGESERPAPGR